MQNLRLLFDRIRIQTDLRKLVAPAITALFMVSAMVAPADAANVLIFGDRSGELGTLQTDLTGMGHTVTNSSTLPADLSSFDTIWHVGAFVALTPTDQSQLAAFLATGKGLHLTGERPCCEDLNASLQTFVNSVVTGGGIVVGGLGDIDGPYPFNPAAQGGITTSPNALTSWNPSASGGMGGLGSLPDANILVTGAGGIPVGAVWSGAELAGGNGRLTLLMDVNWFQTDGRQDVIANIQNFIASGSVVPPNFESQPIPTLSEWGMILLALAIGLAAMATTRRNTAAA